MSDAMNRSVSTAVVSLPSDREVKVERSFVAPRDLVWKAYTTPELLKRWLEHPGWTMPVCEMAVQVGGRYRWRWRSEDGKEFGFHGEMREVSPPARLVHTQIYDPGDMGGSMGDTALITLELTEAGGVTTVTTLIDYGSKENRDAALSTGMTDGMELSYQGLERLLDELG